MAMPRYGLGKNFSTMTGSSPNSSFLFTLITPTRFHTKTHFIHNILLLFQPLNLNFFVNFSFKKCEKNCWNVAFSCKNRYAFATFTRKMKRTNDVETVVYVYDIISSSIKQEFT